MVEVIEESPVYCKMAGNGMGLYNMRGLEYLGLHTVAAYDLRTAVLSPKKLLGQFRQLWHTIRQDYH